MLSDRYLEWTTRLAAYDAATARMAVLAAGAVILLVLARRISPRVGNVLFWGGYAIFIFTFVVSLLELVGGAGGHW